MLNEIPLLGVFKIIVDGELKVYNNYLDIPEKIDNVVSFVPCVNKCEEDLDQKRINSINHYKFLKLMERETK